VSRAGRDGSYKWTVLINTTIGTLMATIDSSIVLISLPAIFRGIHMNPLTTSNTSYLLWMLMSYMVVTAVLVVSFGRIGDMFGTACGRGRMAGSGPSRLVRTAHDHHPRRSGTGRRTSQHRHSPGRSAA